MFSVTLSMPGVQERVTVFRCWLWCTPWCGVRRAGGGLEAARATAVFVLVAGGLGWAEPGPGTQPQPLV